MARRDMDSVKYWVCLNMVLGIGKTLFHRLLRHFKHPKSVFAASRKELMEVGGIGEKAASQILQFDVEKNFRREWTLLEKIGGHVLTLEDEDYPHLLQSIYDPPPILYCKGRKLKDYSFPFAVVGTRKISNYGKMATESLTRDLVKAGVSIVSGMARGTDTVAHKVTLSEGGGTVAVLGCGLDYTYPPENAGLKKMIEERGTLVSEFPVSTRPDKNNFPARNRVISGLSQGTLVIEAAVKSGALITAHFALDQGRDVFAVPGNIFSETSMGPNRLIQKGAKLVDDADDILCEYSDEILPLSTDKAEKNSKSRPVIKLGEKEQHLLGFLSVEEIHIDSLTENSRLSPAEVSATLVQLELKGLVKQLEGKMFITNPVN